MDEPLLAVHELTVQYRSSAAPAVDRVSFTLGRGECVGIFGESGSGKTTLARSLLGLSAREYRVNSGSIRFRGVDLLRLRRSKLRRIRGRELALVAQEPELALNPVLTVGEQIAEVLRAHFSGSSRIRDERVRESLTRVCLEPAFYHAYPHQLSGGQRQRVVIAQALVCKPALLVADEPTSALDPETQAEIVSLLKTLKKDLDLSLLLISHNLDLLRDVTDRVMRMHEGRLMEDVTPASAKPILFRPSTDETPVPDGGSADSPLIEICRLSKTYSRGGFVSSGRFQVNALEGANLRLFAGQTVALVGESGSGKSTLARCMALLETPDDGEIRIQGRDASKLPRSELISVRRGIQLVFQHSGTALNPFLSAEEIVGEPLQIEGRVAKPQRRQIVFEYLERVGLSPDWAGRRPWQFSGGQRQRLAIARAMMVNPQVVIFDEALAGLDLATRFDIVDLLIRLQTTGPKSYLFITHDLQMAEALTKTILVMQDGKITESSSFPQWRYLRSKASATATSSCA